MSTTAQLLVGGERFTGESVRSQNGEEMGGYPRYAYSTESVSQTVTQR